MTIRLNKVTRDLNVGITTVVEFLQKKGYTIEASPNAKITEEQYAVLVKEFSTDKNLKIESEKFSQERQNKDRNKASISIEGFESKKEKEEVVKTVIPEENVCFICPSQIQEDIDKEIINSLHSYKPFSKCLSNG